MSFDFALRHWVQFTFAIVIAIAGWQVPQYVLAYPQISYCFVLLGLSIALMALGNASEGSGWPMAALGWVCVVGASLAALWPIQSVLESAALAFQSEQAYRGNLLHSIIASITSLDRYPLEHQQAINFSLIMTVGLLGIVVMIPFHRVMRNINGEVPLDRSSKTGPWNEGWMKPADIAVLTNNKTGLPLAKHGRKILRYRKNDNKGWRGGHHAVISGTRGGKGVSAVIPAILEHHGPVVALDIKGENFFVTRRHRQTLGRQVVVLNPFSVMEPCRDQFNPLDYVRLDHLSRDIEVIADGLVKPEPASGAHFSDIARELVAAGIEVIIRQAPSKERNLNAVADLLLSGSLDTTLEAWVDNEDLVGRMPAKVAATILKTGERERGSVQSTLSKAFSWMKSDEIRHLLERSSFNLDSIIDDQIDLFIVVPLELVESQEVFMRLFTNLVLGTVIRQDGYRKVKQPILFVLDEFVRMGRMEKILNIATVAAGVGLEALFIAQEVGQIVEKYGRDGANTILGSCITKRIFNINDINTAEWAEKHLGDHTIFTQQRRDSNVPLDSINYSYSEQKQKLMNATQILNMPPNAMLILIGSKSPLKAKLNRYYENRTYKGTWDQNPLA